MSQPTFTLRDGDDWVALYDPKGRKVAEGHSLDPRRVFEAIGLRLATETPGDKLDDETEREYEERCWDFFPESIA